MVYIDHKCTLYVSWYMVYGNGPLPVVPRKAVAEVSKIGNL